MDTKMIGWNSDGEYDIYIIPKYFPTDEVLITMKKMVSYQWKNLADTTLCKWSKLTFSKLGQTDLVSFLVWWTERNATLFILYSYRKCITYIGPWRKIRQTQIEELSPNHWPVLFKNMLWNSHERQRKA